MIISDHYEIVATSHSLGERRWKRCTMVFAKFSADQAISRLGYDRAVVKSIETPNEELYVIEKIGSNV